MKTFLLLLSLLTLASTPGVAGDAPISSRAPGQPAAQATAQLWIAVHVPRAAGADWVSNDTAVTFADLIVKALHAQGFKGKIGTLRPDDAVPGHAPVLVVQLAAWSARDGAAECSFTAALRTSAGDRELGSFSGDNLIVTSDGKHQISSDGLAGSAEEALDDLYGRIVATGLLLRPRQR